MLPVARLREFEGHPYAVRDDEAMQETVTSVKSRGVLVPLLVRPLEDGDYEIISGHRRKRACELAGITEVKAIVVHCDRDEATILMVDSNLQRENILPSERGEAYRMKLEAAKRQGERWDLTSSQVGTKLRTNVKVASEAGISKSQMHRFIRLTKLEPKFQKMVDEKKMAMNPAVEISYLTPEEQKLLLDAMDREQCTPSLSQAQRMKQLSQEGKLNEDSILGIMCEVKKPDRSGDIVLKAKDLQKIFPAHYTPHLIEDIVWKLLENWRKNRDLRRAHHRDDRER